MPTLDIWIQIENRPWDAAPHNIDRMTGQTIQQRDGKAPVTKTLTSPGTGAVRNVTMFSPLGDDALILRRYKPPAKPDQSDAWTVPDDRRINPWDLNEPDPTDSGTMGTIPGAVIECSVGDLVKVHFRNKDTRANKAPKGRAHSLHPHGIVFSPLYDGAYPLSPADPGQPVGSEASMWSAVGVAGNKKGDRVPPPVNPGDPGGTFTYTWDTHSWPSTAGVWLYHDHAISDMENVEQGAIGLLVIHNKQDTQDVIVGPTDLPGGEFNGPLVMSGRYIQPPVKAQYLQLFHTLAGAGVLINGRQYLGNTPTVLAGPQTLMRFGVIGMGSMFHTFHIHGHRWIIPGPDGNTPSAIQTSVQNKAASQFEDTRTFGPANSFVFTVQEGGSSFMGAFPGEAVGEWHMHCHVLDHMMGGMMGSLLIVTGGDPAVPLPIGEPRPADVTPPPPAVPVSIKNFAFNPVQVMITKGQTVRWTNHDSAPHTVTSNPGPSGCTPPSTENFASTTLNVNDTFDHQFNTAGTFAYHCEIHGCSMSGSVMVM